jgi:hypothetical protein
VAQTLVYLQYTSAPESASTATSTEQISPSETFVPVFTVVIIPTATQIVILPTIPEHPIGTSGICNDGTYTYSDNRQGTCSHHDGLAEWWGK